jgi:NADPH:quinone reductase-like Zn-dependent oxidoreductase
MRAVVVNEFGPTEVLLVEEVEQPGLGSTEVRVDVRAAGLNFADVMARLGHYAAALSLPYVGGFEVSGVVVEVGAGVTRLAVGHRVAGMTRRGAFAEQACIDERDLILIPDTLDFTKAAAVPANFSTAYAGLISYGNVQPGERVLVMAAGGGMGIASVQVAKHAGAEVWGAASPGKHDAIRAAGVDHAVDYTAPGWHLGLPGFDVIMDAIGGDSFSRSYGMLRPGGRLVAFGAVSAFDGGVREDTEDFRTIRGVNTAALMIESKTVIGLDLRVLWDDRDTVQPWLLPIEALLAEGRISPVVSHVVSFADAARGHQVLTDRRNVGKVVLVP